MGRRSSIDRLDPAIRDEANLAIKRGATIDEIVATLQALGADVSRSAVGRYSKRYAELAAQQRDMRSMAEAFGQEFGSSENSEGKLMMQLLTSIGARALMPMATEEDPGLDGKEFHFYARAVKDLISAAKTDADRDARIADNARKLAASAVERAGRASGASEATIERVKAAILGIEV